MTDNMLGRGTGSVPDASPALQARSRRAILAGAVGGIGALAATVIGGVPRVQAAAGSPLIIGRTYNDAGTSGTTLTTATTGTGLLVTQNGSGTALRGSAVGAGSIAGFFTAQNGTGVSGVTGNSASFGVFAQNNALVAGAGAALRARGGVNHGVVGSTQNGAAYGVSGSNAGTASTGAAILASGGNNTGVIATSVGSEGVRATSGTGAGVTGSSTGGNGVSGTSSTASGVRGLSTTASGTGAAGVYGGSTNGAGVIGSGAAYGVYGTSPGGYGVYGTSDSSYGVYGVSASAPAVYGKSNSSYSGFFDGRMAVIEYVDVSEMADPANPSPNKARLFVRDNAGKTELCVIFPTGTVKVLSAEA